MLIYIFAFHHTKHKNCLPLFAFYLFIYLFYIFFEGRGHFSLIFCATNPIIWLSTDSRIWVCIQPINQTQFDTFNNHIYYIEVKAQSKFKLVSNCSLILCEMPVLIFLILMSSNLFIIINTNDKLTTSLTYVRSPQSSLLLNVFMRKHE